jgi:PAS domain S-box-containing protein
LLGITRDITDRVLANAALRESEQNFRPLFEQAIDAILVCADDMRFLDANPAACLMTGYTREELLGQDATILLDADERARVPGALAQIEAGEAVGGEWRARRKDGTAYMVEVRVKRLPDGRYQAFVRDITERTELQAQLLQAQKMESIGRLAGGIAHDFNNLLTIINGTADLAIAGLHAGHPLRRDLEQIRHAGERAAAVTRQLLAMSRQQILRLEVLDLNAIIRDMQGMLTLLVGEDITLEPALAERLGPIKADPSQMEQVILNLAVNAREAMPEGGTLTIQTSDVVAGLPAHRPLPPGPYVMMAVRDTGIGMDEAARKRVFEPFFTTKDIGKGAGLGLSTVYGIVKQSGGSVWVDSHPGAGTVFTIYFPRVETTIEPRAAAHADIDARSDETILVVEDEPGVRRLTKRILESAGYRVFAAANGTEALQLLERSTEAIQLTLTDMVMPGMNGRELASRVARLRPGIKVLYMTGYTADALLRRGALDATSRVVTKPFTARELRRHVREILDT